MGHEDPQAVAAACRGSPITLRERPRPGTAKRWTSTVQAGPGEQRASSGRGHAPPLRPVAGRGPARAIRAAANTRRSSARGRAGTRPAGGGGPLPAAAPGRPLPSRSPRPRPPPARGDANASGSREQRLQLGRLGHRRLAGEALAHVGGGPAVHASRGPRAGARRPALPPASTMWGRNRAPHHCARARPCRRPPARPLRGGRGGSRAPAADARRPADGGRRPGGAAGTRRPPCARSRARR